MARTQWAECSSATRRGLPATRAGDRQIWQHCIAIRVIVQRIVPWRAVALLQPLVRPRKRRLPVAFCRMHQSRALAASFVAARVGDYRWRISKATSCDPAGGFAFVGSTSANRSQTRAHRRRCRGVRARPPDWPGYSPLLIRSRNARRQRSPRGTAGCR